MENMLTRQQVAEKLGVSIDTIERLINKREIVAYKLAPTKRAPIRIKPSDLAKYLERNRVA